MCSSRGATGATATASRRPAGPAWLTIPVNAKGRYLSPSRTSPSATVVARAPLEDARRQLRAGAVLPRPTPNSFERLYRDCRETRLSAINHAWTQSHLRDSGHPDRGSPGRWTTSWRRARPSGSWESAGRPARATYVSGPAAQDYIDAAAFRAAGTWSSATSTMRAIRSTRSCFRRSIITCQRLDLLFNQGPAARSYMRASDRATLSIVVDAVPFGGPSRGVPCPCRARPRRPSRRTTRSCSSTTARPTTRWPSPRAAASATERVRVIDLSRNFGHHKAMMTGLAHARGDLVFLIDSDLEEDPELLADVCRDAARTRAPTSSTVSSASAAAACFERVERLAVLQGLQPAVGPADPREPDHRAPDDPALRRGPASRTASARRSIAGLWALTGFAQAPILITSTRGRARRTASAASSPLLVELDHVVQRPAAGPHLLSRLAIGSLASAAAVYLVIRRLFFGIAAPRLAVAHRLGLAARRPDPGLPRHHRHLPLQGLHRDQAAALYDRPARL